MSLFERIYPVHFAKKGYPSNLWQRDMYTISESEKANPFHFAKKDIHSQISSGKKGVQEFAFQEIQEEKLSLFLLVEENPYDSDRVETKS